MKAFVSKTIADVLKENAANRFAAISYSTKAELAFDFNALQGSSATSQEYEKLVEKLPRRRGFTFIDKALLLSNAKVFTKEGGMRAGVSQVLKIDILGLQPFPGK